MPYTLPAFLTAASLFVGILAFLEIGRRIGRRQLQKDPEGARAGVGAVEGAVFALLGLLLAFTFSGAAGRFDVRRQLIVEETNAIGTAYLRLDLLLPADRRAMQELFRQYVDSRLETYRKMPDIEAAFESLKKTTALQGAIWDRAIVAGHEADSSQAQMLLLPALNQMIDITTTRTVAAKTHPPAVIFAMLAALALVSSLLAGIGMAGSKLRNWIHILGFSVILSVTLYVILELEYPRLGLIQVEAFDQSLAELRQSMN